LNTLRCIKFPISNLSIVYFINIRYVHCTYKISVQQITSYLFISYKLHPRFPFDNVTSVLRINTMRKPSQLNKGSSFCFMYLICVSLVSFFGLCEKMVVEKCIRLISSCHFSGHSLNDFRRMILY